MPTGSQNPALTMSRDRGRVTEGPLPGKAPLTPPEGLHITAAPRSGEPHPLTPNRLPFVRSTLLGIA